MADGDPICNGDIVVIRVSDQGDPYLHDMWLGGWLRASTTNPAAAVKLRIVSTISPALGTPLSKDETIQFEPAVPIHNANNTEGAAQHLAVDGTGSPNPIFFYAGGPNNWVISTPDDSQLRYGFATLIRCTDPDWYWSIRTIYDAHQFNLPDLMPDTATDNIVVAGARDDARTFIFERSDA